MRSKATTAESERGGAGLAFAHPAAALIALLVLAFVAGAGGVSAALGNMAVQLAALAALAVHARALPGFFRSAPRPVMLLVAASCLLPLVQLVPLPTQVWDGLPGRAVLAQSLDLAGGRGWYPLSVSPARTLVAFLGTLAPLAVVVIGCGLPAERLVSVQRAVIVAGVAIGLFGTSHLIDEQWGDLYASIQAMPDVLIGTFADRNAAALFFGGCLLLLIGLPAPPGDGRNLAIRSAGGAFLFVCVLLTGSRTGIALLAAPIGLLAWRLLGHAMRQAGTSRRSAALWIIGGLLIAAVVGTTLMASGRVQSTIARIEEGNDGMRAEMREDARYAGGRYWPIGAGMGTFDEVFQIDESLEYVSPRRAGRAHMDYLELAIEAGVAGLALAAAWLAWAMWAGWLAIRRPGAWPARSAVLIIVCIAAQSLLSFPLRNQAMLCLAALAVVMLVRSPAAAPADARSRP